MYASVHSVHTGADLGRGGGGGKGFGLLKALDPPPKLFCISVNIQYAM